MLAVSWYKAAAAADVFVCDDDDDVVYHDRSIRIRRGHRLRCFLFVQGKGGE
jgi:hypothetical protein